jgi:hypothetical protein
LLRDILEEGGEHADRFQDDDFLIVVVLLIAAAILIPRTLP